MSKSTPKYRIEFKANVVLTPLARDRKMTNEQLRDLRGELNKSFLPGGANYHPSSAAESAIVVHISSCTMINQRTGEIVAHVSAPLFEVV